MIVYKSLEERKHMPQTGNKSRANATLTTETPPGRTGADFPWPQTTVPSLSEPARWHLSDSSIQDTVPRHSHRRDTSWCVTNGACTAHFTPGSKGQEPSTLTSFVLDVMSWVRWSEDCSSQSLALLLQIRGPWSRSSNEKGEGTADRRVFREMQLRPCY